MEPSGLRDLTHHGSLSELIKGAEMVLLGNVAEGIRSLFRRQALEREMDDELRDFIDASTGVVRISICDG